MKKILLLTVMLSVVFQGVAFSQQTYKEERVYYTIKKGDYLKAIADMYGTTVPELHKLNPYIKDINKIYPGRKVLFIDRKGVEARKRQAAAAARNKEADAQREQAEREARLAAERRALEERRMAEEQARRDAEAQKLAEEARKKEEARLAEEAKKAEEARQKEEAKKAAERAKQEEEALKRAEDARKAAERERLAAEKAKRDAEEAAARAAKYAEPGAYPMYFAIRGLGLMTTDPLTTEVAPFGFGGALDFNAQITDWFAIMISVDANYLTGSSVNNGLQGTNINIGVKPYIMFQRNIKLKESGVQPYIGVGPAYTYALQDTQILSGTYAGATCNVPKHRIGVAATAGLNYAYKKFIIGLHLDYNYVIPLTTEVSPNKELHTDMTSGLTAGLRLGFRF